eukprot:GHVS01075759.1.p1 GENE.GHVS01075759.1~~GHVS01075759.1.p1  ORF type:complete len:260 (+),score=54.87 GHVS01075759.1:89-868(+)
MSSSSPTLLRLHPEKYIDFPLTLYNTLKTKLVLHNISVPPSPVSFKIKTTAPKCYLVRPSTGVVSPGSSQDVEIVLQPLTHEPPPSGQDRFLIQAICVQEAQQVLPRDYWATVDKSLLHEQRLTVTFTKPQEGGAVEEVAQQAVGVAAAPNIGSTAEITAGQFNTAVGEISQQQQTGVLEYKSKYEEVVKYCLSLEKKNTVLHKDVDELKKQVARGLGEKGEGGAVGGGGGSKFFGLEFWHWFLIVMLGIILMKLTGKL